MDEHDPRWPVDDSYNLDWRQQQEAAERERYALAVEALNRCAAAGANPEDIKTLARECGINPNHITNGLEHAQAQ